MNLLKPAAQEELKAIPEANRLASLQRCTALYAQEQIADALYLIEEGLVKLTRVNEVGAKIILAIRGPGQLFGEEAVGEEEQSFYTEAMVLTTATVVRIPRPSILSNLHSSQELAGALVGYVLNGKMDLAQKVELLCLHDVEHRILYYLGQLAGLLPTPIGDEGYRIPITQLELADLVGATRETTSTTLNQLERRGLVKLSRRLLTVPSRELLTKPMPEQSSAELIATNGHL